MHTLVSSFSRRGRATRVRSVKVMPSGASRMLAASTYTGLLCTQGLPSRTCARVFAQLLSHPDSASSSSPPYHVATVANAYHVSRQYTCKPGMD